VAFQPHEVKCAIRRTCDYVERVVHQWVEQRGFDDGRQGGRNYDERLDVGHGDSNTLFI
jgi:hypothetical protein